MASVHLKADKDKVKGMIKMTAGEVEAVVFDSWHGAYAVFNYDDGSGGVKRAEIRCSQVVKTGDVIELRFTWSETTL